MNEADEAQYQARLFELVQEAAPVIYHIIQAFIVAHGDEIYVGDGRVPTAKEVLDNTELLTLFLFQNTNNKSITPRLLYEYDAQRLWPFGSFDSAPRVIQLSVSLFIQAALHEATLLFEREGASSHPWHAGTNGPTARRCLRCGDQAIGSYKDPMAVKESGWYCSPCKELSPELIPYG